MIRKKRKRKEKKKITDIHLYECVCYCVKNFHCLVLPSYLVSYLYILIHINTMHRNSYIPLEAMGGGRGVDLHIQTNSLNTLMHVHMHKYDVQVCTSTYRYVNIG